MELDLDEFGHLLFFCFPRNLFFCLVLFGLCSGRDRPVWRVYPQATPLMRLGFRPQGRTVTREKKSLFGNDKLLQTKKHAGSILYSTTTFIVRPLAHSAGHVSGKDSIRIHLSAHERSIETEIHHPRGAVVPAYSFPLKLPFMTFVLLAGTLKFDGG